MSRDFDALAGFIPDQSGRTALVTGATGGLGLRVAEVLAAHGARVLIGARNPERGAAALERVAAAASGDARGAAPGSSRRAAPEVVRLDLASLASVTDAAADIAARTGGHLDLLINNGGIMAPPLAFSVDGFESQWATNVIGPAVLTWSLLPAIEATSGSRVVFVSSTRHASGRFDEARLKADLKGENYRGFDYYGRTKMADLLLSHELQAHFVRVGASAISVAAHPGFTATGIVESGFAALPRILRPIANWGGRALGQPVAMGALPILYAATATDVAGDSYFGPRSLGGLRGLPGPSPRATLSTNDELGRALIRVIEDASGRVSSL